MAKTLAKLTIDIAALGAATWFGTSTGRAYGDAPWCAVIPLSGDVYWNCQYRTSIRPLWKPILWATHLRLFE